jgi:hypothetical protein
MCIPHFPATSPVFKRINQDAKKLLTMTMTMAVLPEKISTSNRPPSPTICSWSLARLIPGMAAMSHEAGFGPGGKDHIPQSRNNITDISSPAALLGMSESN